MDKRRFLRLLAAALCLALAFWAIRCTVRAHAALCAAGPGVELFYDAPFDPSQADAAVRFLAGGQNETGLYATLWRQSAVHAQSGATGRALDCDAVWYLGRAADVCGAQFLFGSAPGTGDKAGCAVSLGLAQSLWGAADVTGLSLTVKTDDARRVYRVRGVFSGDAPLALCPGTEDAGFCRVTLTGAPAAGAAPKAAALSFLRAAGLPEPDGWLFEAQLCLLARVFPALWAAALAVLLASRLRRAARGLPALWRAAGLFVSALLAAALLPAALAALPGWLVPSRWGDLAFWGRLAGQTAENLRAFAALAPTAKDLALRAAFWGTALPGLLAPLLLFASAALYGRGARQKSTAGDGNLPRYPV